MRMLRQYLQYVESGGEALGDVLLEKPALNPFEIDVRDTLRRQRAAARRRSTASSGYWIDFAVSHPEQPGRFVLAIECDGASYHSAESARDRDRLRQEQLERLGWRFHRIWSSEWFNAKDQALGKVLDAYQHALTDGQSPRPLPAATSATGDDPPDDPPNPHRRGPRPRVGYGGPITDYWLEDLVEFAEWIESDGLLRTVDEVIEEMMSELGFQRRGSRIIAALSDAVQAARAQVGRDGQ